MNQVNTRPFWSTDKSKSIAKYRWRWKIGVKNVGFFAEKNPIKNRNRKWYIVDLDKNREIFSMEYEYIYSNIYSNILKIFLLDNTYIVIVYLPFDIQIFHIDYLKLGRPFIHIKQGEKGKLIIEHLNEKPLTFYAMAPTQNPITNINHYKGILYLNNRSNLWAYDYKLNNFHNLTEKIKGLITRKDISQTFFIDNYMFFTNKDKSELKWFNVENNKFGIYKLDLLLTYHKIYKYGNYFYFISSSFIREISINFENGRLISQRDFDIFNIHGLKKMLGENISEDSYVDVDIVSLIQKKEVRYNEFPFYIVIEFGPKVYGETKLIYFDSPHDSKNPTILIEDDNDKIIYDDYFFVGSGVYKQYETRLSRRHFKNLNLPREFNPLLLVELPFNDIYRNRLDSIIDTYIDEQGEDNTCIKEIKTNFEPIKYLDYLINPSTTKIELMKDFKVNTRRLLYVLFGVDTIEDDELVGFYYFFKKLGLKKESEIVQSIASKILGRYKLIGIKKKIGEKKKWFDTEDFNHHYDNKLRDLIHDKNICKNFRLNKIKTYVEILCFEHSVFYKPLIEQYKFLEYGEFEMDFKLYFEDIDGFLNQFLNILFLNEIDDEVIEKNYGIVDNILDQNHMHGDVHKIYEQYFIFFKAKNIEKKRLGEYLLYTKEFKKDKVDTELIDFEKKFQDKIKEYGIAFDK